jgi:hypothetical protein
MITAANISQDLHSLSHSFSSKMLICVHSSFLSYYPWNINEISMICLCFPFLHSAKPPDSGSASGIGSGSSCHRQHRIRCNREACGLQRSTSFLEFFIILPPFSNTFQIYHDYHGFWCFSDLGISRSPGNFWELLDSTVTQPWVDWKPLHRWRKSGPWPRECSWVLRLLLKIDLLVIYYINL